MPLEDGGTGGSLVRLTVFYSVVEAKVFVSMLEAHGIFAFAPTELANNAPHWMMALGGVPIMVVESDYEAAKALLDDVREKEPSPPPRKPFWKMLANGIAALAVLALFGVPPAPAPPAAAAEPDED